MELAKRVVSLKREVASHQRDREQAIGRVSALEEKVRHLNELLIATKQPHRFLVDQLLKVEGEMEKAIMREKALTREAKYCLSLFPLF